MRRVRRSIRLAVAVGDVAALQPNLNGRQGSAGDAVDDAMEVLHLRRPGGVAGWLSGLVG